ncbi:hypothetical protein Xbud_03270 [Xenorhabdus budapestensis]|uniref:Uncharacterized protein n=1 Tax=Xenorhabdus budapestensis TaxID=290110 RepID=A0A2D0IRT5_XENBU|nr:hypothetical protein Xbud_03270 [Xenorhabdus budapestensis]
MTLLLRFYYFFILLPLGFLKNKFKDPMNLRFEDKNSYYHFEAGEQNEK